MPVNDAKLDETLNITPTEVSNTPEGGCAKREDQLTDVTNVGITKPDRLLKDDIDLLHQLIDENYLLNKLDKHISII